MLFQTHNSSVKSQAWQIRDLGGKKKEIVPAGILYIDTFLTFEVTAQQ